MNLSYRTLYICQDKGFGSNIASAGIACFAVGAVVSVIGGGFIGQTIYNKSRRLFCIFLGVMTILGIPCLWMTVLIDYGVAGLMLTIFLLGLISSVTGANIRVVVINVNVPETRGTAFAFFNLFDSIGKGIGPAIVAALVTALPDRKTAFAASGLFWVLSAIW